MINDTYEFSSVMPTVPNWEGTTYMGNSSNANSTTVAVIVKGNIRTANTATTILYLAFACMGIVGNGLVVLVMSKYCKLRKRITYVLIVHQSIIDMVASVILLVSALTVKSYDLKGTLGEAVCRIWLSMYPMWCTFVASTYNLVTLTLERYVAIVHPLWHRKAFASRFVYAMMVSVWFVGPVLNLFQPLMSGLKHGKCFALGFWPSVWASRVWGIVNIMVKFLIPLAIMVFCYTRMIIVLRNRVEPVVVGGGGASAAHSVGPHLTRARHNVIKTLLIVATCFVFCWSWNQAYFFHSNLGNPIDFSGWFFHFTVIMIYANCFINPFVYAFKFKTFQVGLRKLFRLAPRASDMETFVTATNTAGLPVSHIA